MVSRTDSPENGEQANVMAGAPVVDRLQDVGTAASDAANSSHEILVATAAGTGQAPLYDDLMRAAISQGLIAPDADINDPQVISVLQELSSRLSAPLPEPAAGPTIPSGGNSGNETPDEAQDGGANFNNPDPGGLLAGIDIQDLLNRTDLQFRLIDTDVDPENGEVDPTSPQPNAATMPAGSPGPSSEDGENPGAIQSAISDLPPDLLAQSTDASVTRTEVEYQHVFETTNLWSGDHGERTWVSPDDVNGVVQADLTTQGDTEVRVSFISEGAGYKNTLGWYKIVDGELTDPKIIWSNASARGSGGTLEAGDTVSLGELPEGTSIGFFLIANGHRANGDLSGKALSFEDGRLAADGSAVKGHVYFSHDPAANPDGIEHVMTGVSDDQDGYLYMGFEDLFRGGDRDFNDIMFTVDFGTYSKIDIASTGPDVDVSITDPDSTHLVSATVQLDGVGELSYDARIASDNGLTVRLDGGTGLTISGEAEIDAYEAVLDSLTVGFDPASARDGQESELSIQVTDDQGNDSDVASTTITYSVNDVPEVYDNAETIVPV